MKASWAHEYVKLGDVTVVYVDLSANLKNELHAHDLLDTNERERTNRFDSLPARRRFILCRAALRVYLSEMMGILNSDLSFTMERNEKPKAIHRGREVPWNFNVSHTEGHGLLAFAQQGRIGVDIELRNERYEANNELHKVLSEHERELLMHTKREDRAEVFIKFWTLKEAFIKAIGEGFRADTTAFTIPDSIMTGDDDRVVVRFASLSHATWELHSLYDNRFVAAFAHELN